MIFSPIWCSIEDSPTYILLQCKYIHYVSISFRTEKKMYCVEKEKKNTRLLHHLRDTIIEEKYVNFPKWQDASFVFSSLLNHSVIPLKSGEAKRINKQKASLCNPRLQAGLFGVGWKCLRGCEGRVGAKRSFPLRLVPQGVSIANRSNMGLRSFFVWERNFCTKMRIIAFCFKVIHKRISSNIFQKLAS